MIQKMWNLKAYVSYINLNMCCAYCLCFVYFCVLLMCCTMKRSKYNPINQSTNDKCYLMQQFKLDSLARMKHCTWFSYILNQSLGKISKLGQNKKYIVTHSRRKTNLGSVITK